MATDIPKLPDGRPYIPDLWKGYVSWFPADVNDIQSIPSIKNLVIEESINSIVNYGKISCIDLEGFFETNSIWSSKFGHRWIIQLSNSIATVQASRYFKMGLFNATNKVIPFSAQSANTKALNIDLIQEPLYTQLHHKKIHKIYRNKMLSDIIQDIILNEIMVGDKNTTDIKIKDINLLQLKAHDTFIPLFIVPFWSPYKTLQYLANYCDFGPCKYFITQVSDNSGEKYVFNAVPLQSLALGEYNPASEMTTLKYSVTTSDVNYYRGDFTLSGPSASDMKSYLGGETCVAFDYFKGVSPTKEKDLLESSKQKYSFQNYDRSYMSTIAGNYFEGASRSVTNGPVLFYDKEYQGNAVMNNAERNWTLDREPKYIIEKKMKNRFYNSFYDQMRFNATFPPSPLLRIGNIYNIIIPSTVQITTQNDSNADVTVTGRYLLTTIKHVITYEKNAPMQYEMKCEFVRTGLTSTSAVIPHNVIPDTSIERKRIG